MKLAVSLFLLVARRESSTLAFAPTSVVKYRSSHLAARWTNPFANWGKKRESVVIELDDDEPMSENGFTSSLLGDQEDDDVIEKEAKSMLNRLKTKTPNKMVERTEEEEKADWEVKVDGIFGCIPTKEMTGVDPIMTQLCSTISAQLYSKDSFDEFKLSTKDIKTELLIYDNHGDLFAATPPFCVAVTGKTMILGWRGTSGLADGLTDVAASPQSSLAWRKHAKTIKAQGPMTSVVSNDIVSHELAIIKKAQDLGINEIITTGQSLGGGCSQIGHLIIRAQMEDETSPWNALKDVNVRSVAFCGPMTTVLRDNATPATDAFLEKLWNNSCNIVYKNDPVPRCYGYLSFIEDFIDDSVDDLAKKVPVPRLMKRMMDVRGKIEDLVDNAQEMEKVADLMGVFSQYRHVGNIVFYEGEDAEPRVLKDMGAFHKNTAGEKNLFRSVKYVPFKGDIMKEMMVWHMDPIRGPGLSFPSKEQMR